MESPASLQANLVYLVGEFAHRFHRTLTAAFRENRINLTVEQFSVLAVLYYKDCINQQEISTLLKRDKTTVARVIAGMVKRKLVRQESDPKDSRSKLISPTAKGRALQDKAVKVSGQLYEQAISGLTPGEIKSGLKLLSRMVANVS